MTLFIAICDDDKRIGAELEATIETILDKQCINYKIDVYFTGEELCKKMEQGTYYNLIFLDIEFAQNAINGVMVGKIIRDEHHNEMVDIVYISWKTKYIIELFANRPFDFLQKPLDNDKIEPVLQKYIKLSGLWAEDFTYKIGHDTYKVQIKDIVYLQAVKRKIVLHLADGRKDEFYGTLKEVYKNQLQMHDFIFIHAAYVVNYDHIAVIKYDQISLTADGGALPISPQKRKDARDKYFTITERRRG